MPAPPPLKPLVLVVEDEPHIRKIIQSVVGQIARVRALENGQEALEFLDRTKELPSLMITDVMMPFVDGVTLAKSVKDNPRTNSMPIIMLTAKDGAIDVVTGINAGAKHYLSKPFRSAELLDKVKSLLPGAMTA